MNASKSLKKTIGVVIFILFLYACNPFTSSQPLNPTQQLETAVALIQAVTAKAIPTITPTSYTISQLLNPTQSLETAVALIQTVTAEAIPMTMPSSTSVPTPTDTPIPIPETVFTYKVTLSGPFEQPVILRDDQIKVTVTDLSNAGNSIGKTSFPACTSISVKPEYGDTYHLQKLSSVIENLTDKDLGFGTESMEIRSEKYGTTHMGGLCYLSSNYYCCLRPISIMKLSAGSTNQFDFIFVVPNDLETFTLFLLGAQSWSGP
jgi:hypothetical protein